MPDTTDPPPAPRSAAAPSHPLIAFAREFLLPVVVLVCLLAIAVALIEGPPLQQFLYAVF